MSELLDIKTTSKRMGLAPRMIYHLINVGVLPSQQAGRSLTFIPADAIVGLEFSSEELEAVVRQKLSAKSQRRTDHDRATQQP